MKFEIEDFAAVKLNSANFRSQLHGEEHVPAVDLGFTMDAPNTILSYFDGFLLKVFEHYARINGHQAMRDKLDVLWARQWSAANSGALYRPGHVVNSMVSA